LQFHPLAAPSTSSFHVWCRLLVVEALLDFRAKITFGFPSRSPVSEVQAQKSGLRRELVLDT
jgi:hypothetical protein